MERPARTIPLKHPPLSPMQHFGSAVIAWSTATDRTGPAQKLARRLSAQSGVRAAVLVEGASDQAAVQALALRCGRDFDVERISVIALGGVTNIAKFTAVLGPEGLGLALAGLYDVGEERYVRRALERAYPGGSAGAHKIGTERMQELGFFSCHADLEEELIASLGIVRVQEIIDEQGDWRSWQILQKQPAQQGRSTQAQLHRFMGTTSGRKIHYGSALVQALDLSRVPAPLAGLLDYLRLLP